MVFRSKCKKSNNIVNILKCFWEVTMVKNFLRDFKTINYKIIAINWTAFKLFCPTKDISKRMKKQVKKWEKTSAVHMIGNYVIC